MARSPSSRAARGGALTVLATLLVLAGLVERAPRRDPGSDSLGASLGLAALATAADEVAFDAAWPDHLPLRRACREAAPRIEDPTPRRCGRRRPAPEPVPEPWQTPVAMPRER